MSPTDELSARYVFANWSTSEDVLQKVVVLAYPDPRANGFQLTAHAGEINAQIENARWRSCFFFKLSIT